MSHEISVFFGRTYRVLLGTVKSCHLEFEDREEIKYVEHDSCSLSHETRLPLEQCTAPLPLPKTSEPGFTLHEESCKIYASYVASLVISVHTFQTVWVQFHFSKLKFKHNRHMNTEFPWFCFSGATLASTMTRRAPNCFHFRRQVIILQRAGGGSADCQFEE